MSSGVLTTSTTTFTHVYMMATFGVPNSLRLMKKLQLPATRQMVDPDTGMLTHEWELKLNEILNAINKINQDKSQG